MVNVVEYPCPIMSETAVRFVFRRKGCALETTNAPQYKIAKFLEVSSWTFTLVCGLTEDTWAASDKIYAYLKGLSELGAEVG